MFNKSELSVLRAVSKGCTKMNDIAQATDLSVPAAYAAVRSLRRKGVLDDGRGVAVAPNAFAVRLLQILASTPNAVDILSDSGFNILSCLREPRRPSDVVDMTGVSVSSVYRRIGGAMSVGAVSESEGRYMLNDMVWPDLRKLFDSMDDLSEVMAPGVAIGSEILYQDESHVVYSNRVAQDAQITAFSYFESNGFPAWFNTFYYTTSQVPMTDSMAFEDAYRVADVTGDRRLRLAVVMYYAMNRDSLSIGNAASEAMSAIEGGCRIDGWPDWSEAIDKARDLGVMQ